MLIYKSIWFPSLFPGFHCSDLYIPNFLNFTHLFFENRTPFFPFWVQKLKNFTIENLLKTGPIHSFFEFKKWRIYGNKWELAETCAQHILDLITYVDITFSPFIPKIPSHISHLLPISSSIYSPKHQFPPNLQPIYRSI